MQGGPAGLDKIEGNERNQQTVGVVVIVAEIRAPFQQDGTIENQEQDGEEQPLEFFGNRGLRHR